MKVMKSKIQIIVFNGFEDPMKNFLKHLLLQVDNRDGEGYLHWKRRRVLGMGR